ncbi:MAG TPA: ATP synthase F0 subunit B [Polyangiaceae bacterium]|nr:ATP synthase F0 subunit B [Polyangiaceae bacterium]
MRAWLSLSFVALALAASPVLAAQEAEAPAAQHGARAPGAAAHGHAAAKGHGEHVPTFDDINWIYGVFGEREGVEPSFLFRPKGMPAPFGIWIFDALLLYGFLYVKTKEPLRKALKERKASILRGMDEAARMKREAEVRLGEYEEKLASMEQEIERVRREMREAGEADRARVLAEARARSKRLEDDAKALVEQELATARDALKGEMIAHAMASALSSVKSRVSADDQQRLADEFLAGLVRPSGALRGRV